MKQRKLREASDNYTDLIPVKERGEGGRVGGHSLGLQWGPKTFDQASGESSRESHQVRKEPTLFPYHSGPLAGSSSSAA